MHVCTMLVVPRGTSRVFPILVSTVGAEGSKSSLDAASRTNAMPEMFLPEKLLLFLLLGFCGIKSLKRRLLWSALEF